jgi:hypothetical protein
LVTETLVENLYHVKLVSFEVSFLTLFSGLISLPETEATHYKLAEQACRQEADRQTDT